jgi:hypothetical protein
MKMTAHMKIPVKYAFLIHSHVLGKHCIRTKVIPLDAEFILEQNGIYNLKLFRVIWSLNKTVRMITTALLPTVLLERSVVIKQIVQIVLSILKKYH